MPAQRRKTTISVGLSPWVIKNLDNSLKDEKYSGQSDLVAIALTEHFLLEEIRSRDEKLIEIYTALLQSDEGKKILAKMQKSKRETIEAMKKRGVACVDLGDLDEAIKWFTRAKELEEKEQESIESDDLPSTSTRKVIIK